MRRLDAVVRARFALSWKKTRERIERGKVWVKGVQILDTGFLVDEGTEIELVADARVISKDDGLLPPSTIRHSDHDIVVVDKPAGLLTVPFEKTDRDTLERLLRKLIAKRERLSNKQAPIFVVHRLDKGTSGLIVFARTRSARNHLKDQFREHSVHRRYIALVQGRVSSTTITSHLVRDRGDGVRGSVEQIPSRKRRKVGRGKLAITHVEAIEQLHEATLIGCRLETGRTNQIRIHLAELGHPLVGETVYRNNPERCRARVSRLCLHAAELGFLHPRTGAPMMFHSEVPAQMQQEIDARR